MNNYEDMTWLEINHAIAEILEPNATQIHESRFNAFEGGHSVEVFVDDDIIEYDFSKPSDAWPIIVENKISIEFDGEDQCDEPVSWVNARSLLTDDACMHQSNPLRAAMICFLKMKDAEK